MARLRQRVGGYDATLLALYATNNKTTAEIDDQGLVTGGKRGEPLEHGMRAAREGLIRPGFVVGHELGDEAAMAQRPVVGSDDVFDLVGQQA